MVRSVGITAVVLGLAWTGLVGAQSSSSPQTAPRERYLTVSEEGKSPQRCKLLKAWREPNGVPVFQVQSLISGEVMTIVGSGPPGQGGDPRAMSTRIFHWGRDNKPPADAPQPPANAITMTAPPAQPAAAKATPVIRQQPTPKAPAPSASAQLAPSPRPIPATLTARKPDPAPSPTFTPPAPVRPTLPPPAITTNKPAAPPTFLPPSSAGKVNQPLTTPMGTQVIQSPVARTPATQGSTPSAPAQPRLVPSAGGTVVSQTGPCGGPTPCGGPCQPCQPCGQPCPSSCVCCTTSPMRQSFISRLFKSHPPCCECAEVVCQPSPVSAPAPAPRVSTPPTPAAKVVTETAKPSDWRESWGKVEPWKATAQAASAKPVAKVTQRAAPVPVPLPAPTDPDPIKAPDMYRDMAMSARLHNSKIPEETPLLPPPAKKSGLFASKRPVEPQHPETVDATPEVASPMRAPGRVVSLPANEANAFWSPPEPPKPNPNGPEGNEYQQPPRVSPRIAPGYAGPLPPPGPGQQRMTMMPMSPDSGVPDAMGNAFTLPGTRRPIPADFGPTPQEPNGFDPMVRMGAGSPPVAYGMGMPRPPMPTQVAMGPRLPMGMNPLMNVPATPHAPAATVAAARPTGVPQLLAKLKDSLYPSERESAAEQLSEMNGRPQPGVVEGLMKSARTDPAGTVRAACVHALTHMKASPSVVTALARDLKSDRDPRVRQEAEEALNALGDSGIQQASHK